MQNENKRFPAIFDLYKFCIFMRGIACHIKPIKNEATFFKISLVLMERKITVINIIFDSHSYYMF